AAKEVHLYADALKKGFELVKKNGLLTINQILQIQKVLEQNNVGFRKLPGTKLINDKTGKVVYTPPQDYDTIIQLMRNLEEFINNEDMMDVDPLIKMAVIHHQFESIHPFYDGNGRTGRIINILYLIQKNLLHLPVLYLSRYIIRYKNQYYNLLQDVRQTANWESWILFVLDGIQETAEHEVVLIAKIRNLMQAFKQRIRTDLPKLYSQDLLNNLFKYPYTKIEYLQNELEVGRNTSIRYLEALVKAGFLVKQKKGRDNFYINQSLFDLLADTKPRRLDKKTAILTPGSNATVLINYSSRTKSLEVEFVGGHVYHYLDVEAEIWEKYQSVVKSRKSSGEFVNAQLKPYYETIEVEKSED
ncbi:MAG TPA: Fic family protein, partial [Chitinophagaceae bacterium]